MKPLVYFTENIQKLARKNGLMNSLQRLKKQVESTDVDDLGVAILERRHPYLRRRQDPFRIIAKRVDVEGIPVIVFLHLFRKDDRDSDLFDDEREDYGKKYLEPLIGMDQLKEFVRENYQSLPKPEPKEPLPESLRIWLEPFKKEGKGEILVLESRQWDNTFKNERAKAVIHRYYDLLLSICESQTTGVQLNKNVPIFSSSNFYERTIYYSKLNLDGNNSNYETIIFLLDAIENRSIETDQIILNEFKWLKKYSSGKLTNIDEIARFSERSYFAFILADEFLWRKVEESDAANPALSAEELSILANVRHNVGQDAVLPLFINGRAGSGKSTMLYHLFADYLLRKVKTNAEGKMIFLTYTDRLLKEALRSVQQLLKVGAKFALEELPLNEIEKTEQYFQSFIDFLKQMIQNDVRIEKFKDSNFVDFGRFKLLYSEINYEASRLPADVAWHIIRTYIKGYKYNGYLTPDEYEDLPLKEKSIPREIFEEVYFKIWKKYEESEYWDTQDLVRYILQNNLAKPEYAVVFCDEAQDFTRVELDLILHLLIYRKFDLGWERNLRLPFTMAGDPFQTLNPTGFRWEAIKAAFYDEIVSVLDSDNRKTVGFNYQELTYNYRSTAPIVKFSNLLQFWRKYYFGAQGILPQKPWRDEHIIPPRLYILGKTISDSKFFEEVKNSVIIVPCEYGQEKRYIDNDDLLKKITELSSPPVILSPMQAKGLEFPRVFLYGFGKDCPDNFFDITTSAEIKLKNEYFLNKLYVAVTRATHYLVIVDTPEGEEKFWDKAVNYKDFFASVIPKEWFDYIGGVTSGEFYSEIDEQREDPLDTARRLEQGSTPDLQRQAASFFRRAGENTRAEICEARAFKLEGEYLKAGQKYEKVAMLQEAEESYWKGFCWDHLLRLYTKYKNSNPLIKVTAELMISPQKNNVQDFISILKENAELSSFIWDESPVQKALQKAATILLEQPEKALFERFASLLKQFPSTFTIIGSEMSAKILFYANKYNDAIRIWEQNAIARPKEFYLAKAEITENPNEKIGWLKKANANDYIIKIAETVSSETLNHDTVRNIGAAYFEKQKYEKTIDLYWKHGLYEEAVKVFEAVSKKLKNASELASNYFSKSLEISDSLVKIKPYQIAMRWYLSIRKNLTPENAYSFAHPILEQLIENEKWLECLEVIESFKLKGDYDIRARSLILWGIAKSKNIHKDTVETRQALTTFIQNYFSPLRFNIWNNIIDLRAVSAAIEKVGKNIDALRFYEELFENHNIIYSEFIRQRWAKVKYKQIERMKNELEKSPNNISLKENIEYRSNELEKKLKKWGLERTILEALPDYPDISFRKSDKKFHLIARWQAPYCQIHDESRRTDISIAIDVRTGSVIPIPPEDVLISHKEDKTISISIYDWNLEGILIPGKSLKLLINNKLWKYFKL